MMNKVVIWGEDNPGDEDPAVLALAHGNMVNPIGITRDREDVLRLCF